jgi:hypothetical protein
MTRSWSTFYNIRESSCDFNNDSSPFSHSPLINHTLKDDIESEGINGIPKVIKNSLHPFICLSHLEVAYVLDIVHEGESLQEDVVIVFSVLLENNLNGEEMIEFGKYPSVVISSFVNEYMKHDAWKEK